MLGRGERRGGGRSLIGYIGYIGYIFHMFSIV